MYHRPYLYITTLFAATLFLFGLFYDIHLLRLCTKPIPLLILIYAVCRYHSTERAFLGALIFSVLGDIILELPDQLPFAAGLGSFLIAHLLYIRCFLKIRPQWIWLPLIPIILYCGTLFFFMQPNLGPLLIPVAIYVLVISTMLWSASVYSYSHKFYLPLWGAIMFTISDSLIAINKFISEFQGARYSIIITYWIAQYLIFTLLSKDHSHES